MNALAKQVDKKYSGCVSVVTVLQALLFILPYPSVLTVNFSEDLYVFLDSHRRARLNECLTVSYCHIVF